MVTDGMSTLNFNTANQTYKALLGNTVKFKVPSFQRDYSWSEDEWDDLWQDMLEILSDSDSSAHYMGYLVLQSSDNKNFSIIDGQQRLTTLSIVILSGLKFLQKLVQQGIDPESNMKRCEEFMKSYIGYIDPITLSPQSKLELNRHNDNFYQTYLVTLEKIPSRGFSQSEHKLRKTFNWFYDKFNEYIVTNQDSGKRIAEVLVTLVDKLFFTVITVTDELNAFKVFETLNARGVRLSSTDLLKNYIFSLIDTGSTHENKFNLLESRWDIITGRIGSEAFPEFLRVFWNSRNKLVRKSDLFKTIRKNLNDKHSALNLVKELDYFSDVYAALRDPDDVRWNKDEKSALAQLMMFNVRQPLSMLIASYNIFFEEQRASFTKVLLSIAMLSFRYNIICNLKTYEQEKLYSDISVSIFQNCITTHSDIIHNLMSIYPSDDFFFTAFSEKQLRTTHSRNKKILRYILFEIEQYKSGNAFDFSNIKYSIEHILPENPEKGWNHFDNTTHERMVYRLGNMILMNTRDNKNIGNSSFNNKLEFFKESEFHTTKKIFEHYKDWTINSIESRQSKMAKAACEIWKIRI